ncbi:MAG: Rieske (2Fe-2S) protein [Calditrichaeota bacterium]|nr:MAG: Rieske (2Fe-2S) protein [Calditrichota bacterium]
MKDKKKNQGKEDHKIVISRREFLNAVGTGALVVSGLGAAGVSWSYLSPNVLFEPPLKFKVGKPEDYTPGTVTLDTEKKIFVVREEGGFFYCMSAVCTHLGCLTFWKGDENKVACPCHGSRFSRHGDVIKGPAPRPLPHFLITLDDRGNLVVDKEELVGEDYILKV